MLGNVNLLWLSDLPGVADIAGLPHVRGFIHMLVRLLDLHESADLRLLHL